MSLGNKLHIQQLNKRALVYLREKQLDNAYAVYHDILKIDSTNDNAHHMVGIILGQKGETDRAIGHVVDAITIYGWCADYYNTLAGLQLTIGKCNAALNNINTAIQLNPDHAGAYNNLGMILMELGRHQEALQAYERSLEIKDDEPYVHFNYALALLMLDDWEKGFQQYEWRNAGQEMLTAKQPYHYCQVEGTLLCLIHEQGFGDTIHFSRYATELAKSTAETVIGCPKELVRLMNTLPGVTAKDNVDGKWHFMMPMMSLPRLWSHSNKKIPDFKPYLSVPAGDYSRIYEKLNNDKFKIGLVWGSRRDKSSDYDVTDESSVGLTLLPSNRSLVHYSSCKRSIHPTMYAPLSLFDNVALYSLQKGPDAEQLKECALPITDLGSLFEDFADTAAAIDKLDLVIAIDTSVAHLAGAMGKPVWTLLPYSSEWRWGWNQKTTPWYPSMRLFKQKTPGDWLGVFEEVVTELQNIVAGTVAV